MLAGLARLGNSDKIPKVAARLRKISLKSFAYVRQICYLTMVSTPWCTRPDLATFRQRPPRAGFGCRILNAAAARSFRNTPNGS